MAAPGFLVGPDLVLTNHHVLASVIRGETSATNVRFVFDHHVGPDGTIDDGIRMRLAADWHVASSPSSPVDDQVAPDRLPDAEELDYALVRLAEPVPESPYGPRGWFDLRADPPAVQPGQTMLVLQHPDGWRLKMAVGPVLALNGNLTRVIHHVNTTNGSSGGPVLTLEMRLAALHQAGSRRDGTARDAPKVNVAVPIDAIRRHLIEHGRYDRLRSVSGRPDRA